MALRYRHSDSANATGSDTETMDRMLDLESGMIKELKKPGPGMWRFPTNRDRCCIYRVPSCIRLANPEAYTPEMVLIGPLHRQSLKSVGDATNTYSMDYFNMEEHKKIYLAEFAKRVEAKNTIDEFRRIIEEEEDMIRASYSESTAWIESPDFVEMILHDSVFILEFLLRIPPEDLRSEKTGDPLIDEPCLESTVGVDLMLLENQLPYFILEKLFEPIVPRLRSNQTFRELVINYFKFKGKIGDDSKFRHFTDLYRCVRVETLPEHGKGKFDPIKNLYNAEKLHSGGVNFKVVDDKVSIEVKFKKGCLTIPCFLADGDVEITLRNIMALEQCHYPFQAHVCNYVIFLDYLIDNEKDVDLLVEKEVIENWIGHHGTVAKMVNNLCSGVIDFGSYYSRIASDVMKHYGDNCVKSRSILKSVYFSDLWTGTATIAATLLLLMTLIQTVTSIMEVLPKKNTPR